MANNVTDGLISFLAFLCNICYKAEYQLLCVLHRVTFVTSKKAKINDPQLVKRKPIQL